MFLSRRMFLQVSMLAIVSAWLPVLDTLQVSMKPKPTGGSMLFDNEQNSGLIVLI